MDPSQPDPEKLQPLIFRACTAWEAKTGRKLGDEASIVDFLRALKTSDLLLNADQATDRKLKEALAGLDLSTGASLPGILSILGIPEDAQQLFLTTLQNSAQREARITNAFAADSPADTARALETIAFRDNPHSLFTAFFSARPAEAGNKRVDLIILLSLLAALLILCAKLSQGSKMYKGVTPDPGGGNG